MFAPFDLTRRRFVLGLTTAAVGLYAAACGPQAGGTQAPAAAPKQAAPAAAPVQTKQQVPVTILAPANYLVDHPEKLLPIFHEKNPDIKVEIHHTAKMTEHVITRFIAGDLEDIYTWWMGGQDPQVWFVHGITRAIDDLVKTHKVDSKDWYKNTWDAHFVDGKQFSMPWQGQTFGFILYYNQNQFDEVGLKYPTDDWTVEDMIEAGEKLKIVKGDKVERWGVRFGEDHFAGERFPGYVRAFDSEMFSVKDQKEFLIAKDGKFQGALDWYSDAIWKRIGVVYTPGALKKLGGDPKTFGGTYDTLGRGTVSMVARGWLGATGAMVKFIKEDPNFKYGAILQPKGPQGRRGGWTTSASTNLNKTSKNPDEAFRFMLEFTGREWSVARGLQERGSTTLNGRPDVYHDVRLQQSPYVPKSVALTKAKAMDATENENTSYEGGGPWNFRVRDLWKIENTTTRKITEGIAPSSKDIVDELDRLMEPVMKKPRPGLGISR